MVCKDPNHMEEPVLCTGCGEWAELTECRRCDYCEQMYCKECFVIEPCLCKECEEIRIEEGEEMEDDIAIICPHCKHNHHVTAVDLPLYVDEYAQFDCEGCKRVFEVAAELSVIWYTRPMQEKTMGELKKVEQQIEESKKLRGRLKEKYGL